MNDRAAVADCDSVTAPWSNMMHHRVPVAGRDHVTKKLRRVLAPRRGDNAPELWGRPSAKDWARAMLGGTYERGDVSSALGSALRSSRDARTPKNGGLVPGLRKMISR
jgi:hypothetical protein